MYWGHTFKLHRKGDIREKIGEDLQSITRQIEGESEDYILNANAEEYSEYLSSQYQIDFPELHFDKVYADSYEKDIPAEHFPGTFHVYAGKKYKKQVIEYYIPYSGNINILEYAPYSTFSMGTGYGGEITRKDGCLVIEFVDFRNDPEEIKRNFESAKRGFMQNYGNLKKDCDVFNNQLYGLILNTFNKRKEKILKQKDLLSSLGVPLKQKGNTPQTFSVPKPQIREKVKIRPQVHEKGFTPEPALDNDSYKKILNLIHDVGQNFERMPSLYKDKSEEDLRDHILLILDPNFELGSASGETFNKKGKTDILLKYDSSVVFIAECKFWKGEKQYLDTIDQLLGYLTWRNSKASVIIFSKNKDFSLVLEKIKEVTPTHPNYLGYEDGVGDTWNNYRFHINGDKNRILKLAVLCYNIP